LSYQDLGEILKQFNHIKDENILSSFEYNEDAAVYRITRDIAIVFTVDFITPVVDDPYVFGQIAAANALSDIFAMGGKPLLALNITCFPEGQMDDLNEIIRGGLDKVQEAGAILVGGHSLQDKEPKYGLSVLGIVHPDKIIKNHTPQEGDALILTKPLGTGIISTALKAELISENTAIDAINYMRKLNNIPEEILNLSIHSMTDITGFGLLGHLSEMIINRDLHAEIRINEIPVLTEAYEFACQDIIPGGSVANQKIFSCGVKKEIEIDPAKEILLYDAQTSGGLLISISDKDVQNCLSLLKNEGFVDSKRIGKIRKNPSRKKKIILIQ
jgi:selenide,water dikinase